MKQTLEFRKVRSFEDIISATLLFIKSNLKPLLKNFVYLCGFFMLGGMISSIFMQVQITSLSDDITNGNYRGDMSLWNTLFGWRYLLAIIFMLLNYTALFTSVLSFAVLYVKKGNVAPTIEEVWDYFKTYFFRMLWSGLLLSVLWGVCWLFCLIPGMYVTPAFSIIYVIMMVENVDFGTAFGRAFALVKQNWWITFATIFVIVFITGVAMTIVYAPAYILMMISMFTQGGQKLQLGYQVFISISQYLVQVFMIIPIVAMAFIYYNLVERKESVGLLERIDNFGNGDVPLQHPDEEY